MHNSPFQPYTINLLPPQNVTAEFFRHAEKRMMLVTLKGTLPTGSAAREDCDYIQQHLALHLVAMGPFSLLLDLSELSYTFGNSFIHALSPLSELPIFESGLDVAYLLSDRNKEGLSGLWNFDLQHPPENIFFRYEEALAYAEAACDRI